MVVRFILLIIYFLITFAFNCKLIKAVLRIITIFFFPSSSPIIAMIIGLILLNLLLIFLKAILDKRLLEFADETHEDFKRLEVEFTRIIYILIALDQKFLILLY